MKKWPNVTTVIEIIPHEASLGLVLRTVFALEIISLNVPNPSQFKCCKAWNTIPISMLSRDTLRTQNAQPNMLPSCDLKVEDQTVMSCPRRINHCRSRWFRRAFFWVFPPNESIGTHAEEEVAPNWSGKSWCPLRTRPIWHLVSNCPCLRLRLPRETCWLDRSISLQCRC